MDGNSGSHLETVFGPLEIRVLQALWTRRSPASVKDLQPGFPGVAYTTLMTTLDRLFRKGTLSRAKSGRAFYYQPKHTHDQLVLSMFVDTVGQFDKALLDELEALVRARREQLKESGE